jgi:putative transposase
MKLATPISLDRLCQLALVSRAGFYRWQTPSPEADPDLDLRDEIQRIALEYPYYGWPRITAELKRRGWQANHKRVYRIMREDNLLCLRRRKFVVATTNPNHTRPVYPNLANGMVLTGVNQLWVADITYIRLELEFVYLAVVLDAFSRRVIGWALERTLEDDLTLAALRMALEHRSPASGLVHHSDRGVQYASSDYTGLLKDRQITISMSRKGNPYDNAFANRSSRRSNTTKSTVRNTAIWPRRGPPSGISSDACTTRSGCTRRSATVRRPSLKAASTRQRERRNESALAFSQA